MGEHFVDEQPIKSIRRLPESIQSLLGFKDHVTPSWVESVRRIIKSLPSAKLDGGFPIKSSMCETMELCNHTDAEIDATAAKIQGDLSSLEARLNYLNLQRRQALHDYLDLKGNIRVLCRVRPFLEDEKYKKLRSVIASDSSNVFLDIAENKRKQYNFDHVFQAQSRQEEVFAEIEPVIKSVLDGYNACIFAYGQTGTGKTFTMEGNRDCPGVVPRGIEALFEQATESNHNFLFTFSMLEIYMGSLRDLLAPKNTQTRVCKPLCLSIQMDPDGGIEIENLVSIEVNDFKQVKTLYNLGTRLRSTASTMSNSKSSRSHCLIRISLTCLRMHERRRKTNKLWMVDFGGSERLLKTQASGRRLEEGKAINLSLSALGDVISALRNKNPHVPYRNSKLTQVLRDSLGSDSKTLMLVHISPKEEDLCETVCSLGFAMRVRSIHLGLQEPEEVKAKKEVAISDLLQKVKHIESESQYVRGNIARLNEKLKLFGMPGKISRHIDDSSLFTNRESNVEESGDLKATSSSLPRFMRPTVSSRKRNTANCQPTGNLRKKPPKPSRRKSASVYAESVTCAAKSIAWQSDHSSECSLSTVSNWKNSADGGAESSHGASESEIKKVIFPLQEKSPRGFTATLSGECVDEAENCNLEKQLTIENWIQLQMTEQTAAYSNRGKRVLAITIDDITQRFNSPNCDDKNDPAGMHYITKALLGRDSTEKQVGLREELDMKQIDECSGDHKNQAMEEKPMQSVVSSPDITNRKFKTNEAIELLPETGYEVIRIRESSLLQAEVPESKENAFLGNNHSQELYQCEGYREFADKPSVFTFDSTPATHKNNTDSEDLMVSNNNFREEKEVTGMHHQLIEKFETLWGSAVLGSGIQSFGLGHDFFHALMY